MKMMVIGGAGYLGSSLVPALLEREYEVAVVDLLWFGNHLPEGVEVQRRDALDLTEEELAGFDQVIFLAGLSNDPMAEYSPSKNFVFNAATPAYVCYIAKRAKVRRYIYASTCSVYGYAVDELSSENSEASSFYPYGISKLQGERAVLQMVDDDFSVIALRKGTVCGHSPRMRFDLVVNTMFKTAVAEGEVRVNNPSIWRPILSVQDAVSAYVRAVEAHESVSGIFNIVSGNHTIGEVGDIVKHEVERLCNAKVRMRIRHLKDYRNYKVDYEKAAHTLSFKPRGSIESIVQGLADNRDSYGDLQNPLYYNIEVFKGLDSGKPAAAEPLRRRV